MTRAIMCRREGLTQAEESALYGSVMRPRPDMAFAASDMVSALLFLAARALLIVAAVTAIVGAVWAAKVIRTDMQNFAPTVAEVLRWISTWSASWGRFCRE